MVALDRAYPGQLTVRPWFFIGSVFSSFRDMLGWFPEVPIWLTWIAYLVAFVSVFYVWSWWGRYVRRP